MKTKEKVLDYLEERQGATVSGEDIARALGISRNSVWKAINQLKESGVDICSTKAGYVLSSNVDVFSAHKIMSLSKNKIDVVIIDDAPSSNAIAKELATNGAKEGTIVIVKRQSAGKGRMGRSFISNEENGLYMSIILRPELPASESVKITVIGAVAALEAIEKTSNKECSIKWVNDIYISDKKVCGILTEGALNFESSQFDYAILGIGVNITPPKDGFNEEIKSIATAIFSEKAPKGYKSKLCAEIVDTFLHYYKNLKNEAYIASYREKSNLIGKRASVYRGNEVFDGLVIDIDNDASLVLKTEKGILKFNSGEARVRRNEQ